MVFHENLIFKNKCVKVRDLIVKAVPWMGFGFLSPFQNSTPILGVGLCCTAKEFFLLKKHTTTSQGGFFLLVFFCLMDFTDPRTPPAVLSLRTCCNMISFNIIAFCQFKGAMSVIYIDTT